MINSIHTSHPAVVFLLGDFLGHHYHRLFIEKTHDHSLADFQHFVMQTLKFMMAQIHSSVGAHIPLYPVLGNNDSFGDPSCKIPDYCVIAHGQFLKQLAPLWATTFYGSYGAISAFGRSFVSGGYYSMPLTGSPDTEVVALNTVLFSTRAIGGAHQAAAIQELSWLHKQLQTAQGEHRHVLLLMHIPPTTDWYHSLHYFGLKRVPFWQRAIESQFMSLMTRYRHTIVGMMSSHIHMDSFALLPEGAHHTILDTMVPAVSPINGNNPGYKIYEFSTEAKWFSDFKTFYLPLSTFSHAQFQPWTEEYDFNTVFNPDCRACDIKLGYERINQFENVRLIKAYLKFYGVSADADILNRLIQVSTAMPGVIWQRQSALRRMLS